MKTRNFGGGGGGGTPQCHNPNSGNAVCYISIPFMSDLVPIADLSPAPRLPGATRAYHAMVKPVGAICNIDCTYCYYLHKQELLGSESKMAPTGLTMA